MRGCSARRAASSPILLLDEVAAHLDAARREALFAELLGLESQVWLTGTDTTLFSAAARHAARFLSVSDGALSETALRSETRTGTR